MATWGKRLDNYANEISNRLDDENSLDIPPPPAVPNGGKSPSKARPQSAGRIRSSMSLDPSQFYGKQRTKPTKRKGGGTKKRSWTNDPSLHKDRETLLEELGHLKQQNVTVQKKNQELVGKLHRMESKLRKKDRDVQSILSYQTRRTGDPDGHLSAIKSEQLLINTLRKRVKDLEDTAREKDDEIYDLRHSMKHAQVNELSQKCQSFFQESQRLKRVLELRRKENMDTKKQDLEKEIETLDNMLVTARQENKLLSKELATSEHNLNAALLQNEQYQHEMGLILGEQQTSGQIIAGSEHELREARQYIIALEEELNQYRSSDHKHNQHSTTTTTMTHTKSACLQCKQTKADLAAVLVRLIDNEKKHVDDKETIKRLQGQVSTMQGQISNLRDAALRSK